MKNNSNTTTLTLTMILLLSLASSATTRAQEEEVIIRKGYSAKASSTPQPFQPLVTTNHFSLGFLLVGENHLDLAVVHLPSHFPLWRALSTTTTTTTTTPWSPSTTLSFDGQRLLLSSENNLFWSAHLDNEHADIVGESKLVLLNTSNLQIITNNNTILWQSFDFPSDTIVEAQNFTSTSQLRSDDRRFAMRLGPTFLALYMEPSTMYWRETAMQARAEIVEGKGPLHARINASAGYFALYQTEGEPVDVIPFDTFNRGIPAGFRRLTLENDGNLIGYYWNGTRWVVDYKAISDKCDLPSACGAYGVCKSNITTGDTCECLLDNNNNNNMCTGVHEDGGLCSGEGQDDNYYVVRREGVDLAYTDLMSKELIRSMASLEDCESWCQQNCSCWGAIFSNSSASCYIMPFPIQTLQHVEGVEKIGYFKVKKKHVSDSKRIRKNYYWKGIVVVLVVVLVGVVVFLVRRKSGGWRWHRSEVGRIGLEEGLTPAVGYKDLKTSTSFRSTLELSTK